MKDDLIDLVYCWCDSSDENFQREKEELAKKFNADSEATNKCRFIDNEELRYSLRSVEKNAPWINKIYIITNKQVPHWLNLNHPKIKIVDHTEIMPKEALPNFNSNAIEHCIKNIPNLSEKFLYANDDMLITKPVLPEFFFDKQGYPINRFDPKTNHKVNHHFAWVLYNAENLIINKFGKKYHNLPHHSIDAYRKSDVIACYNLFKKEIDDTIVSQFRDNKNISRHIYGFYSCAISHGRYKIVRKIDTDLPILKKIFMFLTFKCQKDTFSPLAYKSNWYKRFKKYNPTLFCLNDCERTTDENREHNKLMLEKIFPIKSSFEK